MHLIQTLAAGVNGAANGTATIKVRGTSTNATYYTSFDGGDGGTTGTLTLDSNGGAVVYVDQLVDVVVANASGTTVRSFTEMVGAANVEVKSQSFTGTDYDTAASAASNPTTVAAVLDKWRDNAGGTADDIDWKVDVNGTATTLTSVGGATVGFVYNVKDPAYGAVGGGITDDTSFIAAAITAASNAGGGTVYFPDGTYLVTSTLTVPSGVSLLGVSLNSSIITMNHASTDVITVTGDAEIRQLAIQSSQNNSGNAVKVDSGAVRIIDCKLGAGSFTGTSLVDTGDVLYMERVTAQASGTATKWVNGSTASTIYAENCTFTADSASWAPGAGDGGIESEVVRLSNCVFEATSSTAAYSFIYSADAATAKKSWVTGCAFHGNASGTVTAMEIAAYGSDDVFVESGNSYINVDFAVEVTGITDIEDSVTSLFGSRGFLAATESTAGAVTYTVKPSNVRSLFLTRDTSNGALTIDIDETAMVPPGHPLMVVVENSSGGALNVDFDATQFEGTHVGSALSVTNGDHASWLFMSVDNAGSGLSTQFVQVGAHVTYTP